ncbi:hypothetical protein LUZ63_012566 [Rhynchospora breviuscula]|uniref:Pectinesterase n=1 Tax=Rhynchospora breviuscula TaxID=2022672 RepID=A0A9Q0CL77_9POAL|nr:hypothetical protein LUZ63_012566 [Rhynchospora breviuscula]
MGEPEMRVFNQKNPKPNAVVAKDRSGQFKTINDAIKAIPVNHQVTTRLTATFTVEGQNFIAKDIGFRNTTGAENHQAIALCISGDFDAFYKCRYKCRFDGFQDTLYTHIGRQFFSECTVSGTIDFIFGNSTVVFQNCIIICNRPLDNQQNTITAHDKALEADKAKMPSYLGRPWKLYSRAVIMESSIGNYIHPKGWFPWNGNFALKTLYFTEYGNTGLGASTTGKVKWGYVPCHHKGLCDSVYSRSFHQ